MVGSFVRTNHEVISIYEISEEVNEIDHEQEEEFLLSVHNAIGLTHPIMYGDNDICKYFVDRKLNKFTVEMLTAFEVQYASDRKSKLVINIEELVKENISSQSCSSLTSY